MWLDMKEAPENEFVLVRVNIEDNDPCFGVTHDIGIKDSGVWINGYGYTIDPTGWMLLPDLEQ